MLQHFLRAANNTQNITYVGGYTAGYAGTTSDIVISLTSLTGGVNTQPAPNDLVIVCFCTGSTAANDIIVAGYTEIVNLYANDTYDSNSVVRYKFMTSTPDTSVTITGGTLNTLDAGAVYISVWRGVAGFDVPTTTTTGINSVLANPPAITPVTNGSYVVAYGAGAYAVAGNESYSSSDLNNFLTSNGSDTNDAVIGGGSLQWTTGAVNPAAFTFSGSDNTGYSWTAASMALRPGVKTIQYIDSTFATQASGSGTNFPITAPTGAVAGDYLVCFIDAGTRTVSTPAGWTLLTTSTTYSNFYVFGLSLPGAPAASYTFVMSSSVVSPTGVMLCYRNQSGTPITATGTNAASTTMTCPAITNSEIGLVVSMVGQSAAITITAPANMTQRENGQSTSASRTMAVFDKLTIGNFDATNATASVSGNNTGISVKLI